MESDKATLTLVAEKGGEIKILAEAGSTVPVGETACKIDTSKEGAPTKKESKAENKKQAEETPEKSKTETEKEEQPSREEKEHKTDHKEDTSHIKVSPVAKKLMEENNLSLEDIIAGLKRLGKKEVQAVIDHKTSGATEIKSTKTTEQSRDAERQKMSSLRRKLSERLVQVKNETAMLTIFNGNFIVSGLVCQVFDR